MTRAAGFSIWIYRWLSHALPEDFLKAYGREMIATGELTIQNIAARRGVRGLVLLMFHLVFDLVRRLPAEHLSEFTHDLRHGGRVLANSKGMVLVIALSTGLAIAVSLGNYNETKLVFHPVPGVGEPQRLFTVQMPVSYSDFERYAEPDGPFAELAAYMGGVPISVNQQGEIQRLWGHIVTPNYFEVLRSGSAAGRIFQSNEQVLDATDIVIGEGYWQRRFGGSANAIGQNLQINNASATITGVAAKEFLGPSPLTAAAEIWISTKASPRLAPELVSDFLHDSGRRSFQLVGRLKPGITASQAEAQLDAIEKQLEQQRTGTNVAAGPARGIRLLPGGQLFPLRKEDLATNFAPAVAIDGLLLLVACANAGTLLLARTAARSREITIRVALGASRRRIIKQLLTESFMLAIPAALVGLALALFMNHQSQKVVLNTFPSHVHLDLSIGWSAIALGFSISVVSAILFGIVPALKASRVNLVSGLKAGNGRFLPGYRWFSSRNALVVVQVASSICVVILAGIVALGFERASKISDFGFEPRNVYSFSIDPLREGYQPERAWDFLESLPGRLQEVPGITDASVALKPPIENVGFRTVAPRLASQEDAQPAHVRSGNTNRSLSRVTHEYVDSGYFSVLSVRPLSGRVFTPWRAAEEQTAVVVNEALAKEAWGSENPIGRQLEIGGRTCEVIGVVNDFRSSAALAGSPPVINSSMSLGRSRRT
jgi:predicted permease